MTNEYGYEYSTLTSPLTIKEAREKFSGVFCFNSWRTYSDTCSYYDEDVGRRKIVYVTRYCDMNFHEPDTPDGTVRVEITYTQKVYKKKDSEEEEDEITSFPDSLYKRLNPGIKN